MLLSLTLATGPKLVLGPEMERPSQVQVLGNLTEQTDRHSGKSIASGHHGLHSSTCTVISTELHQSLSPASDVPRRAQTLS